ncbi:MAG TPA: hypothetical protein VJ921_08215 [Vicinamibacteria bacterium]|nr:hypothetical protein [Vicinamibacteria bacterium]
MKAYLQAEFPGNEISEELDASRDVIELRVQEPDGRTLLAEVASSHTEGPDAKTIARALDRWNLAQALRDHFRVLVTPQGLEPLPWKQLAADRDVVEEMSEGSFPASDPAGHSAATPEQRRR